MASETHHTDEHEQQGTPAPEPRKGGTTIETPGEPSSHETSGTFPAEEVAETYDKEPKPDPRTPEEREADERAQEKRAADERAAQEQRKQ